MEVIEVTEVMKAIWKSREESNSKIILILQVISLILHYLF